MLYKTICLELIQQRPAMHDQLRKSRTLLATVNRLATELKESHQALTKQFMLANPTISQEQITSEAMEMAVQEMVESLPPR